MIKKITLTGMLVLFVLSIFSKEFKQEALTYLKKDQKELKLSDKDIADLVVVDDVYDDYSQINRVWFQQTLNGILVKNGFVSVHFKDGKVVNSNNSGIYDLNKQIKNTVPVLTASDAVVRAASFVNVTGIGAIKQQEKPKNNLFIFEPVSGLSKIEVHAQLAISRDKQEKVQLAWIVQFHSLDGNNFWSIDVNAENGALINKYDQILHCDFGTGKFLESQSGHQHETMSSYIGTPSLPQNSGDDVAGPLAGSYRVYPYTVESPAFGTRQLISNPDDAVASPYGWHDDNGAAGAEYTTTRGNNVYAYADKDANNSPDAGSSPDGTATLSFDFPLDFGSQLDTLINSKAIVTQLFYMNNIMHDIFYKYGFTDANRNFQGKNYASGNTATDNDFVWAEAHDGSGTNNANFATAPDGTNTAFNRSRMQMYMWDGTPPSTLTYNAPAPIAGDILHGSQNGWGPCSYNVTGSVVNATSATTPATYVCGAVNNASAVSGKIALIDRGICNFSEKVYNAQQAGAIGVIIINRQSAGDSLIGMASGTSGNLVTIPALFVTYADGQKLRDNIATANVTMFRQSTTGCLDLDGSLDNGIVSHEYGHGISTRLTGFSSGTGGTSACLSNEEQAGEGWSDFFALALTKKTTDNKNTARGIGNYAFAQDANGSGIRRYPYSYDMAVNPLTYADMAGDPEVHAIGEIWTAAVWDMYWNLIEKYGYSTDLYNGTLGNNRAIKLVMEGLKLQSCNPGFLNSRDAILKADSILYAYADRCEIWNAFARRGMGFSAKQGLAGSATDQIAGFDLHPLCNTSPTATASFTASDTTVCVGSTLTFTNTSTASSGSPDSVRWTIPGGTPSTSTSSTTVTPTFSTAGTYVISLVAYKSGNASVAFTKSIRVKSKPTVGVNSPTICSGQTASLTGTGATTYTWTGGLSGSPTAITPALTTTTTYTVTGTTQGCTNTAVATVTVNPSPTVGVNSPSICSGQTASLTGTGATTYTWTGGLSGSPTATTPALTTTTTYTVTGTLNGCPGTAVATVSVTPLPNVSVNSPGICNGQTAVLTASGATSYVWSTSATGSTISVSPSGTTTYTVTGTTGLCSKTVTSTVAVTNIPTVSVNSPTICAGQTASLTASGANSYTWTGGLSGIPTVVTPALTTTTTYTVTGTTNGCSSTATSTVTVNPSPTINVNSPTICAGQTASLTATGATSYTWTGGLAAISNPTTPALSNTTTYTVTGLLNGCPGSAVSTVSVTQLPNVTVTSPSICSGSTATLQASGATSYTWTGGLSPIANPTTPTLTTTTTYTVTGTTGLCSKTAVSTVSVNSTTPTVTITPNPASVCIGDAITLTGNGANNYTWTNSQTGTTSGGTLTFTPAGDITVNLSGTVTGCTTAGTSSIGVTVKQKPTVGVSSPSICSGQTAQPVASGAVGYTWTGGLAAVSNPTTPALTTTTTYTVTGMTNGCTNTAVSTVSVTTTPITPSITQSHDTLNSSTIVVGGTYKWYLGATLVATTTDPFYKFTTAGSYTVTVTKTDCTSAASAAFPASSTGVRNTSNSVKLFEVYPNPTEGRLVMNLNLYKTSSVNISIYTPEGREVYVKAYGNTRALTEELNINEFAKGVYIIKLRVDEETYYHKVVKN